MKIWRKRISRLITESINDEAVYRTAPATPGLLNMPPKAKDTKNGWSNEDCQSRGLPYVCAAYPGIIRGYRNLTLLYTKENTSIPYFEVKFRQTGKDKGN